MFKKIVQKMPCTEKFLQWILPRGLLVMLALATSVFFVGYAPRVESGIVEYKVVTGRDDHGPHVLILQTDHGTAVLDEEIKGDALRNGASLFVDESLEDEIGLHYTDIEYRVSVILSGTNKVQIFSVPRDFFNFVETNTAVRFEIDKPHSDKIRRLIGDEQSNPRAIRSYDPEYSGLRQFMYQ